MASNRHLGTGRHHLAHTLVLLHLRARNPAASLGRTRFALCADCGFGGRVVPEIIATQGVLLTTLKDAKLLGATAGLAYYGLIFWLRGSKPVLGTIVVGSAVYLGLRLVFGW